MEEFYYDGFSYISVLSSIQDTSKYDSLPVTFLMSSVWLEPLKLSQVKIPFGWVSELKYKIAICIHPALKRSSELMALWKDHSQLRPAVTDPEAEDLDAPAWSIAYTRPPRRVTGSSTETTSPEEQEEEQEMVRLIPEVA